MKQFNRFLLKATLLVFILILCDKLIESAMDMLMEISPDTGDEVTHIYYSFNKTEAPILIVGSSRARHHYDPRVIIDSLGMDAFNTGLDGNFLSYQCALINAVLERYIPKEIIWECGANSLYEQDTDPVYSLHPYYYMDGVSDIVNAKEGNLTKYKMLSGCYRYNGVCLPACIRFAMNKITGVKEDPYLGFVVRDKQIDPNVYPLRVSDKCEGGLSEQKEELFAKTIDKILHYGIRLIIVDSPLYELPLKCNNESQECIKHICEEKSVLYLDYRYLWAAEENSYLFCDHNHLNTNGAVQYTKYIINAIK